MAKAQRLCKTCDKPLYEDAHKDAKCHRGPCAMAYRLKKYRERVPEVKPLHRAKPQEESPTKVPTSKPLESFSQHGDTAETTRVTGKRVKTLDDLIEVCEIDPKIWTVDRWECNKWEVGAKTASVKDSATGAWYRPNGDFQIHELWQVKAWLVKTEVKRLQGKQGSIEFIRQFREVLATDQEFKFSAHPIKSIEPRFDPDHHEIAVVPSSDLHLTETVRPDDANGMNVYGSVIASNRLWEHSQKAKTILARHMSLYKIDKIWVPIMGDIVNGSIHEEYIATNDLSDPAAVVLATRLYKIFFAELKALGLPIEVDCVHGNHARLTPKVPTKRQARTNLDWLIYEHLADMLEGDDQIKFDITTSQIGSKKLYNWEYKFEHGIDVKSGAEEAFEDRLRALFDDPVTRAATGNTGTSFDMAAIGNMHKPKFLERSIVNGSYIGQNELGQSWRLKPIPAQQLMWGVTEKFVRTWMYGIDLTAIKHENPTNPMSEYATWFMKKHSN